jgi:hypothetical protein
MERKMRIREIDNLGFDVTGVEFEDMTVPLQEGAWTLSLTWSDPISPYDHYVRTAPLKTVTWMEIWKTTSQLLRAFGDRGGRFLEAVTFDSTTRTVKVVLGTT